MRHILSFLCGPSLGDCASNLLRCERVCKWFKSVVADDKLWGYFWSAANRPWRTVPIYGPTRIDETGSDIPNSYYDSRFNSWRGISMWNSSFVRAFKYVKKILSENYTYGFHNESSIAFTLAHYIFRQKIWPDLMSSSKPEIDELVQTQGEARRIDGHFHIRPELVLREDSAEMLFTLVGEHLMGVIQSSYQVEVYGIEEHSNNGDALPVLDKMSMRLVYSLKNNDSVSVAEIDLSHLSLEESHQFDSLIRKIAYRSGVVMLNSSGYDCAKTIYCETLYRVLNDAW